MVPPISQTKQKMSQTFLHTLLIYFERERERERESGASRVLFKSQFFKLIG